VTLNQELIVLNYSTFAFNCHFVGLKLKVKEQITTHLVEKTQVLMGLFSRILPVVDFVENQEGFGQKAFFIFHYVFPRFPLEVVGDLEICFVFFAIQVGVLVELMGNYLLEFFVHKTLYLC
jgi:hypothetical protein